MIELVGAGPLRIVSPLRQIWGWLGQAGESRASAWVEPAIADERVEVSAQGIASLAGACARFSLAPSKPTGPTIGGQTKSIRCVELHPLRK